MTLGTNSGWSIGDGLKIGYDGTHVSIGYSRMNESGR